MKNNKQTKYRAFMRLNERGQCCIPKYLRDKWDLKQNSIISIEIFKDDLKTAIMIKEK